MANEVVINVTADTSRAKAGLAGIADKMKSVGRAATVAGGIIAGIGVASITSFAKMGDEVQKMALRTGFSTEALSELRVAAELSGSSLKGMETGIRRMSKVVVDAKDGLAESKDALDRMGVSIDDLVGKSPEQQFEILTMALADMSDKTDQVATAQEVFGRAGTALLPMLAGGAAGLEEMRQKAHEMGVVFDQEAADKAAKLSDSFTTLKGSVQGVMLAIAEQLAPVITDVAEKVGTAITRITAWTDANPGLTQVIVLVTAAVGALLLVLGPLMMVLPGIVAIAPAVGAAFAIMMGPVGLITLAIAALIAGVVGLAVAWNKNLGGIREKTQAVFGFIKDLYTSKFGWILPGGALIKALIMLKDNWGAIWGGMTEFVASIWTTILETVSTAINVIIENLNKLIDGFNTVFRTSIPPIEEMASALMDLGSAAVDAIDDFIHLGTGTDTVLDRSHLQVDKATAAVEDLGNVADETASKVEQIFAPKDTAEIYSRSPFLQYAAQLQAMGRPMEDLTAEARKLSDMFGISMSQAIDDLATVGLQELRRQSQEYIAELLAGTEMMAGRAATGNGGSYTPAQIAQADQGFIAGVNALMAGDDPKVAWEEWKEQQPIVVDANIDGKKVDSSVGEQAGENAEFP